MLNLMIHSVNWSHLNQVFGVWYDKSATKLMTSKSFLIEPKSLNHYAIFWPWYKHTVWESSEILAQKKVCFNVILPYQIQHIWIDQLEVTGEFGLPNEWRNIEFLYFAHSLLLVGSTICKMIFWELFIRIEFFSIGLILNNGIVFAESA